MWVYPDALLAAREGAHLASALQVLRAWTTSVLGAWASSRSVIPVRLSSHSSSPGSTLPKRVAITRPSSGVNPMVVSIERLSAIAHEDAPAPRWQLTIYVSCSPFRVPDARVAAAQAAIAGPERHMPDP